MKKAVVYLDTTVPSAYFDDRAPDRMRAQEYVAKKVFPERYFSDGLHVAIAVVHRIEYLVSWNFSHLVKVNTRREVNLINALKGYGAIEIVAPPEL